MSLFRLATYSYFYKRPETGLSEFIESLNFKLDQFISLLVETIKLHRVDYESKMKKISSEYTDEYSIRKLKFEKLLNENSESGMEEYEAYQIANYESGCYEIDQLIRIQEEELHIETQGVNDLFLKAMLITLYSIFQTSVDRVIKNQSLPIHFSYGTKTQEIDFLSKLFIASGKSDNSLLEELENFRIVRNRIVHGDSIIDPNKAMNVALIDILRQDEHCKLCSENGVFSLQLVDVEFLIKYYWSVRKVTHQILWLIEENDNFNLLKLRFLYLLKFSDEQSSIESISVDRRNGLYRFKLVIKTPKISPDEHRVLINVSSNLTSSNDFKVKSNIFVLSELIAFLKIHLLSSVLKEYVANFDAVKISLIVIKNYTLLKTAN